MNKTKDYWIKRWKMSHNFSVEYDRIKPKSYIFSTFPKTNIYGFQDGNIRKVITGDFFSRFLRMMGYNVLFPLGYDSLGLKAFIENKKRSNVINDDISLIFKNQMLDLGVGIDPKCEIDLKHNVYLSSLQLSFIELYERGYIKYGDVLAYVDSKTNKYYDLNIKDDGLNKSYVKAFYLDISFIGDIILDKIKELNVNVEFKNKLISFLKPNRGLDVRFYVNGHVLNGVMKNPELMGGISFIALNPDYIDFQLFTDYSEFLDIEKYLNNECDKMGVFSGSCGINPLTGEKIPVYISNLYDEGVHIGIPCCSKKDLEFALNLNIDYVEILEDSFLINSDFLNGMSLEVAKEMIISSFLEADLASVYEYYDCDKIIVSSSDQFGALLPFLLTEEEELYSLKSHLPFFLSNKFRPVIDEGINVMANALDGSINHIFSSGMLPIISFEYDDIGALVSLFNKDLVNAIKAWNGIDLLIVSKEEVFENIFFPICIFAILENEFKIKLPSLAQNVIVVDQTCDKNGDFLRKINNNIFDIEKYLNKYGGDVLRLVFLKNRLDLQFVFKEELLDKALYLINDINDYYHLEFSDGGILPELKSLALECIKLANDKKIFEYVDLVSDFYSSVLFRKQISVESGILFLKLLYPIMPFVTEDIYEDVFKSKYLISDDGLDV